MNINFWLKLVCNTMFMIHQFPRICGSLGFSCLLSRENGGILQSKAWPSSLSILNVPLEI